MDSSNLMVQSQFRVCSSVLLRRKKKMAYRNVFPPTDNYRINIVSNFLVSAGIYQLHANWKFLTILT